MQVVGCQLSLLRAVGTAVSEKNDYNWNAVVMATLLFNHVRGYRQTSGGVCI